MERLIWAESGIEPMLYSAKAASEKNKTTKKLKALFFKTNSSALRPHVQPET